MNTRRIITSPIPVHNGKKSKSDSRRLSALKAHFTRSKEKIARWKRRLKRATREFFKWLDKAAYYEEQIEKETA